MVLIFAWALAEGVSWPLLAETPLMVLAVTGTRRTPLLILSAVTGSLCGIVATWWLAWHGVHLPAPLTTPHMEAVATAQLSASPTGAFLAQTVNGIPVKVYAAAAGHLHLPLTELLWAVWPRLARTVVLGTAAFLTGRLLRRYLQPMLGAVEAAVVAGYPFALGMVVSRWR
jgi:membrane protein YqaA with SNARE-associated domain